MIKVNEYLGGKVKSLGAESRGEDFTSGVMLAGEYTFSTEKEEHIVVTLGEMEILVPGGSWKKYVRGETAIIPEKREFHLRIPETAAYLCFYK